MYIRHPHAVHSIIRRTSLCLAVAATLAACGRTEAQTDAGTTQLQGIVFEDENLNGVRDGKEKGLARVRVSNGRDVVMTDVRGRWFLNAKPGDTIFVIKPRHWIPPLDKDGLPQFHYVHNPSGSPEGLDHAGVKPTPEDPGVIYFALYRNPEEEQGHHKVALLGDPQSRNLTEVDYLARDVVEPMVGTDVAFGIGLGDLAFDDLGVLPGHNAVMGRTGIPWFNVHGNHDMNFDVDDDALADETWQRIYGPATYSFDWGTAHYIVIDNVIYDGNGKYHGGFTEQDLDFIEADLEHIGKQTLVVLLMHIPLTGVENADELLRLIADRPNTVSVSAHYHMQEHHFLDFPSDTQRTDPHHHLINATACGSWWKGAPDEYGIPHAMMSCGAPNGHTLLGVRDFDYSLRFVPAGTDPRQQMHIFLPGSISQSMTGGTEVVANIWSGSKRSSVRMRIDDGPWITMAHDVRPDPYYEMAKLSESLDGKPRGMPLPNPRPSPHIWVASMPSDLAPGGHVIEVESTDMFGNVDTGHRIFRVTPESTTGS
ncbi:MAG: calcineurin-like phosphoesterase family protein [Phycisphaerales bacterium]|nr:calcineurin-like phosphoesterase family protein [Phycisphaerales bacterium]